MPGTGTGLDAQIGFALESAWGTPATPTRFFEFTSEAFVRDKVTVQGTGLRAGGRVARVGRRLVTTNGGKGTLAGDLVTSGLGPLFAVAAGSSTSTQRLASRTVTDGATTAASTTVTSNTANFAAADVGATITGGSIPAGTTISSVTNPTTAVLSAAATATASPVNLTITRTAANSPGVFDQVHTIAGLVGKSLTIQKGVPSTSGTVYPFEYNGVKVSDLDIAIAKGGLATLSASFDARQERTVDTTPAAAPLAVASYSTTAVPFSFLNAQLTLGGVALAAVTKANVKLTRPMKADRYFFNGGGLKAEQLENNWATIGGSMDVDFTSVTDLYSAFETDATLGLVLTFTGPNIPGSSTPTSLTITVPAIKLNGETPKVGNPDVVQMTVPYVGLDDGTNPPIKYAFVTADSTI